MPSFKSLIEHYSYADVPAVILVLRMSPVEPSEVAGDILGEFAAILRGNVAEVTHTLHLSEMDSIVLHGLERQLPPALLLTPIR